MAKKRPKAKKRPNLGKIPGTQENAQGSFQGNKIRWSFSILDMEGPFGWSRCTIGELKEILERFRSFETMTWAEIENRGNHAIPIDRLSKEARKHLEDNKMDEDEVFSLRISSSKRVIGIRDRDVFNLLWWDPEHKVCPVHQR